MDSAPNDNLPPKPLLSVKDLSVHFHVRKRGRSDSGTLRAVDGVSFNVFPGETLGIVGESGCGKTTVARAIIRLVSTTSGEICFQGQDLSQTPRDKLKQVKARMQMVFQDPMSSLDPRMTIGRAVAEPLDIHRTPKQESKRRVDELLELVGLQATYASRYPHELSGGQRQRVCIARALALNPKLIICDEPVSALDVSIQSQILSLLISLQEQLGIAYIFVAHNLAVVRHISHRIAVMYLGRIVEIADTAELFLHPRHPYTQTLLSAVPKPEVSTCTARSLDHEAPPAKEYSLPSAEPPDPINPPTGCPYHPRCEQRIDKCFIDRPQLNSQHTGRDTHSVSCHLYGVNK